MSRESSDEIAEDGTVLNGYDYALQVWVIAGICQDVGLVAAQYAGKRINDVPGHEVRQSEDR